MTLLDLKLAASGRYKCEVSIEGPTFETYEQEANLTVIGKNCLSTVNYLHVVSSDA